jgi:hypothetical protein
VARSARCLTISSARERGDDVPRHSSHIIRPGALVCHHLTKHLQSCLISWTITQLSCTCRCLDNQYIDIAHVKHVLTYIVIPPNTA